MNNLISTLDRIADIVKAVVLVAIIVLAAFDMSAITYVLFKNGLNAFGVVNGVAGWLGLYAAIELCRAKWPFKK